MQRGRVANFRKKYAASNRRQSTYRALNTGRFTMRPDLGRRIAAGSSVLLIASAAFGAGVPGVALEEVVITAKRTDLVGVVQSASQGTVTRLQLEMRPVLRTGELLETV